jgi:dynein heavy chain
MIETNAKGIPKATDWKGACVKMMKDPNAFKEQLLEAKTYIDDQKMPKHNMDPIRPYLEESYFNREVIINKSAAAAGVCEFIKNIVMYYDVVKTVEPKRKAVAEATEQLQAANAKLAEMNALVASLQRDLAEVQAQFDSAIAEKNEVVAAAERLANRLDLAKRLITALGSEDKRWSDSIVDIKEGLKVIVGDVLLSSAFVSYAGPFTKEYREEIMKDKFLPFMIKNKIPMSPNPDPMVLLVNDATTAEWNNQGLPSDQVSKENGAILTNAERYPLMIDPQLQGITWIKAKEAKNKLQVTRLGDRKIMNILEQAIENGQSVLIENMGQSIDATLNPIIARNTFKRGNKKILKIGGKDLVLSDKFRLFMHTKLANPHYPPEIQAEATLINFTVTEDGLGDQLLTLVVSKERPDLAKKKMELIQQQNDFKIKQKELEDGVLYKLANAPDDILSDVELVENLESSKRISNEIEEKVIIAKATEIKINEASEQYRPVANRGALIFFLMNELYKIHLFYVYSLESFVTVIHRAIDSVTERKAGKSKLDIDGGDEAKPEGGDDEEKPSSQQEAKGEEEEEMAPQLSPRSLRKRVDVLTEIITNFGFNYVRRGLFEKHKLIVSSMLCLRIQERLGRLKREQVVHLYLGKISALPGERPESLKSVLNELQWAACVGLEEEIKPEFEKLTSYLESEILQWKKWLGVEKAEKEELPKSFQGLSSFYRLLLLRALRPDRLPSALTNYVNEVMGEEYVQQAPFDIFQTFKETDKNTPIFFVLFPGVDPTPEVERVGATLDISSNNGKFVNISMGQG